VSVLDELAGELRAEGGLLAGSVTDPTQPGTGSLIVEAIREGELVHYGEGRVFDTADPDLALLAGDHLYALGLSRLAETGDLAAVSALADLIARCARAHAEGQPADRDAAWRAFEGLDRASSDARAGL
jgi:hypothetical protein